MRSLLLALVFTLTLPAQEILPQKEVGAWACGPCAFVNMLSQGKPELRTVLNELAGESLVEKVEKLIATVGKKPSISYPGKTLFVEKEGMSCTDLGVFSNLILKEHTKVELASGFLDRGNAETLDAHLHRVHATFRKSLDQGVPLILSFRSFAPQWNEKEEKYLWTGLSGHFVTVVEVQEDLRENEKGFSFQFIDPFTGRREFGYAAIDEARNFTAAKGNAERWEWKTNRPFLLVTAPSLRLQTAEQDWFLRTIIIANYAIGAK